MDIFSVFSLLGGLAFFLYGMNIMSEGLEKMAGSKFEGFLKSMTSTPLKGLLLGVVITALIQSSSAVTVMLVGLVNSGIMSLTQSIGVIMGSNIGTTITAWILSLMGIEGESFFVRLLKPDSFTPVLAFIGILLVSFTKSSKKKNLGSTFLGFALLMTGMSLMSASMKPLADMPAFQNILTMFSNPVFGILAGILITALIQSSSASVGILQSISLTGMLTYGMALPIIMGQNIGTCITSLIASIGTNKNAKRVTAVHISFNVVGTIIVCAIFYTLNAFINFDFLEDAVGVAGIAIIHSAFNIFTTAILFPFSKLLEKLAKILVPDRTNRPTQYELLDQRLLNTPSVAIAESMNVARKMASLSLESMQLAMGIIEKYDVNTADTVKEMEEEIDEYEDKIGTFLVRVSGAAISSTEKREASELLHCIGDFERISDHALNIVEVAEEIHTKELKFSAEAKSELNVMKQAVLEILDTTFRAFETNDIDLATAVEPLEQVIDELKIELKDRHIARLQEGKCTIQLGFVLSDIINNFERIADHCSNIAVYIIQVKDKYAQPHEYLTAIKTSENEEFMAQFNSFSKKYRLPARSPDIFDDKQEADTVAVKQ